MIWSLVIRCVRGKAQLELALLTVAGAFNLDLKLYGDWETRLLKSLDLFTTRLWELTDAIARLAVLPIPAP